MSSFAAAATLIALALPAAGTGRVSLDVKDAELHNVLRLLADVGGINLVLSAEVKGKVTLHLAAVDWREAFAALLAQHSLGMERTGEVVMVDTLERMTERAERRARVLSARSEIAPPRTVLIPVRYADAKSLLPIVRALLSPRGTVAVDERTNTLIVTDARADEVKKKISLDPP